MSKTIKTPLSGTDFVVNGSLYRNQPSVSAQTANNTLTYTNLLAGIITATSSAAFSLTLPTGANMDAGFSFVANPSTLSFEWNVINLGSSVGNVTVLANTNHTIVGNPVTTIGSSSMWKSVRTGANTWISYNITNSQSSSSPSVSYTTTVASGVTTTLNSSSTSDQFFTGTSTQTILLPDNATLSRGASFRIVNNTTQSLTIQSSTGVALLTLPSGINVFLTSTGATNTVTDWDVSYRGFSTITGTGSNALSVSPTIANIVHTAGTATLPVAFFNAGSLLTTPVQGSVEWDGNNKFISGDTVNGSGRQLMRTEQRIYLVTGASAIAAGTDFFPLLRPAMLANHLYHFTMYLNFTKTTAGTVTWQIKNSNGATFTQLDALLTLNTQGGSLVAVGNIMQIHAPGATTGTAVASQSMSNNSANNMVVSGFCVSATNTRLSITPSAYGAGSITTQAGSNMVITDLGNIATATYGNVG